ncbi:MAG: YgfZ/GcvT domain-containing protein [bacterium]
MTDIKFNIKGNDFALKGKYCPDSPLSVLNVSGEDASAFLQGQFTQDLSGLADGDSGYGFLLNQRGRVTGDGFVRRLDEEHWQIVSWSLSAAALIDRLDAYIIADDVELSDETSAWRGFRSGADEVTMLVTAAAKVGGFALALPQEAAVTWLYWVVPVDTEMPWPDDWKVTQFDLFEAARIAVGWPRVPQDLGDSDVPQEGGRHLVGVSFTKGCYLGQEVMARLAATGRLRRGLAQVHGRGTVPVGDLVLVQGDRTVGSLRSRVTVDASGWMGMAMMQLAHFDAAQPIMTETGETVDWGGFVGAGEVSR